LPDSDICIFHKTKGLSLNIWDIILLWPKVERRWEMCVMPGYFEDRRPSSNMDPYVVCGMIAYTTLVWKPGQDFKSGFNRRLLV
jgi:hypothetical protein